MVRTKEQVIRDIEDIRRIELCVATNEGTYSAQEGLLCVGTGDPHFCDRKEYETVDGRKRATGPEADRAPGRMRHVNRQQLVELRMQLSKLREELEAAGV